MERDTLESIGRGTSIAAFGCELSVLAWDLRWLFLTAFVLIIADFWFGTHAAHKRGDHFRTSRAIRRTLTKGVDYVCVTVLGGFLGMGIGEPLGVNHEVVAAICMLIAIACEIDSIYSHWCEIHDLEKRFSISRFITGLIGLKSKELKDVIEESKEKKDDETKQQ